jgi:hypothetical protein
MINILKIILIMIYGGGLGARESLARQNTTKAVGKEITISKKQCTQSRPGGESKCSYIFTKIYL